MRVGSSQMWPEANSSLLQPGKEPNHDYFKDEGFEINWSLFKWVNPFLSFSCEIGVKKSNVTINERQSFERKALSLELIELSNAINSVRLV